LHLDKQATCVSLLKDEIEKKLGKGGVSTKKALQNQKKHDGRDFKIRRLFQKNIFFREESKCGFH